MPRLRTEHAFVERLPRRGNNTRLSTENTSSWQVPDLILTTPKYSWIIEINIRGLIDANEMITSERNTFENDTNNHWSVVLSQVASRRVY